MSKMTIKQEAHLARIKKQFLSDVDKKYRKGQVEHGGNLFEKPGMLDMALEEITDLYVYLITLKEQIKNKHNHKWFSMTYSGSYNGNEEEKVKNKSICINCKAIKKNKNNK